MKTVSQLKQSIYKQVQKSGYLKSIQAQLKAHILQVKLQQITTQLIDNEPSQNKQKLGFSYQHPIIKKLRNYPLTSLCLDLIQQFLQSFKFKYTLNVFKKQINRDLNINRSYLNNQFNLDLSSKNQSVLLSIVQQITNSQYKIPIKIKQPSYTAQQKNNYINDNQQKKQIKTKNNQQQIKKKNQYNNTTNPKYYQIKKQQQQFNKYQKNDLQLKKNKDQDKRKQQIRKQQLKKQQLRKEQIKKQQQRKKQQQAQKQKQKQKLKKVEQDQQKQKGKVKKSKKEQEKPPQGATDLLSDVVNKFALKKTDKKLLDEQQFRARKAFSQQKQSKIIVPQQSGSNKIRGVSLGKTAANKTSSTLGSLSSTFMKFTTFNNSSSKNQQIKQQIDQCQQSKDSTRKNPLYSSSQSGLDKSYGYDQSVDSIAIEEYQCVERAKKFNKKY